MNNKILSNSVLLYYQQIVNYLVPVLITLVLTRKLGAENFSVIAISQSLTTYFIILVEYGFNFRATREIANTGDHLVINKIFGKVISLKLFLFIVITPFYLLLIESIETYETMLSFLRLNVLVILANVLNPYFYFQGIENFKNYTIGLILQKSIHFTLVITLIRDVNSILFFQYSLIFTSFLLNIFLFIQIVQHNKLNLKDFKLHLNYLKDNFSYLLSRISSLGTSNILTIISSLILPLKYVSLLYLAEKIVVTASKFMLPVQEAIFPAMSKKFNWLFYRKIFIFSLVISLIGLISLILIRHNISYLFLKNYDELFVQSLMVMSISIPFSTMYMMMGSPLLLANNEDRIFNQSSYVGFISTLIFIGLIVIIGNESHSLNFILLSFCLPLVKLIQMLYRYFYARKFIREWRNI